MENENALSSDARDAAAQNCRLQDLLRIKPFLPQAKGCG